MFSVLNSTMCLKVSSKNNLGMMQQESLCTALNVILTSSQQHLVILKSVLCPAYTAGPARHYILQKCEQTDKILIRTHVKIRREKLSTSEFAGSTDQVQMTGHFQCLIDKQQPQPQYHSCKWCYYSSTHSTCSYTADFRQHDFHQMWHNQYLQFYITSIS